MKITYQDRLGLLNAGETFMKFVYQGHRYSSRRTAAKNILEPEGKLSNVRKSLKKNQYLVVITRNPSVGTYLISIGDPNKTTSKILAMPPDKQSLIYWAKSERGNLTADDILDLSGENIAQPYWSQEYVEEKGLS